MRMAPRITMLPTTPPTINVVDLLCIDDGLVVAECAAPAIGTRVADAAFEVEADFVEEFAAVASRIAEYNGLPV